MCMTQIEKVESTLGTAYEWRMESNPSTGYGWQINAEDGLTVESEFKVESDLCGAPGTQVFRISAKDAGTYSVTAEYRRPWEHCEPLETKRLEITFL